MASLCISKKKSKHQIEPCSLLWTTIVSELDSCLQGIAGVVDTVTYYLHEHVLVEIWNPDGDAYDVLDYDLTFNEIQLFCPLETDQRAVFSSDRPGNRLIAKVDYKERKLLKFVYNGQLRKNKWELVPWPTKADLKDEEDDDEVDEAKEEDEEKDEAGEDEEEKEEKECDPADRSSKFNTVFLLSLFTFEHPVTTASVGNKIFFFFRDATWELNTDSFVWSLREEDQKDAVSYGEAEEGDGMRVGTDGMNTVVYHDHYWNNDPLTMWNELHHTYKVLQLPAGGSVLPSSLDGWLSMTIAVISPCSGMIFGGWLETPGSHTTVLRYTYDDDVIAKEQKKTPSAAWSISAAPLPFTNESNLSRSIAVTTEALFVFLSATDVWRYHYQTDAWNPVAVRSL